MLFPQGSGGIGIRWELQPGDKCFCVVNERSIDRWINDGLCADPQVNRKFDMTDGLCIPFATGSNSPQTDGIFIASDGTVTVGSGTTGPVAQASKVEAQLQTILDAITNATTVPQDGGAAFKTAILVSLNGAGFPGSVASSNLESED